MERALAMLRTASRAERKAKTNSMTQFVKLHDTPNKATILSSRDDVRMGYLAKYVCYMEQKKKGKAFVVKENFEKQERAAPPLHCPPVATVFAPASSEQKFRVQIWFTPRPALL